MHKYIRGRKFFKKNPVKHNPVKHNQVGSYLCLYLPANNEPHLSVVVLQ
uniref:Uncharacterized protein n=1 Tax=Arundo donax TaxID=35708 RepID=A0A0A9H748_ARUDO